LKGSTLVPQPTTTSCFSRGNARFSVRIGTFRVVIPAEPNNSFVFTPQILLLQLEVNVENGAVSPVTVNALKGRQRLIL
jgi:hypothetical protein